MAYGRQGKVKEDLLTACVMRVRMFLWAWVRATARVVEGKVVMLV